MEKIKSILSPGKHADDEILYGSGRNPDPSMGESGSHLEHTSRGQPGSMNYGGMNEQPQNYDRATDSIPSQPTDSEEYNKVDTDEVEKLQNEKATRRQGSAQDKTGDVYHKDSRNPYTKHSVDPRLGEATEDSKVLRNTQAQGYDGSYEPIEPTNSTRNYKTDDAARSRKDDINIGTAHTSNQDYFRTAEPKDKSNHEAAEPGRTSSGQYRTRIASIIDPSMGNSVKSPENAYEHTPSGGGADKADEFHGRESRVASITMPDGMKYKDPEADDNYGLDYASELPGGVRYRPPGVDTDHVRELAKSGRGTNPYEPGYEDRNQPQVATTKSEAARAVNDTTTGRHDAPSKMGAVAQTGTGDIDGHDTNGARVAVADAGYEGTRADKAHPHSADDPAYKTARASAQKYDVEVPRGNDYGKEVKDPRYGLPMSAAGISAAEAEALRNNEAYVAKPIAQNKAHTSRYGVKDEGYAGKPPTRGEGYAAKPPTRDQGYATIPPTKDEEYATKSAPKEEKSRRSSILGFLHLDKTKSKKKHTKDEEQHLANKQQQQYTDRSDEAPIGTAAAGGYTGQQTAAPGTMASQGESADFAYRARQPSTADAPAFTGGLVGANGVPLNEPLTDPYIERRATGREILGQDRSMPGAYGGATHDTVPSSEWIADEAYGDETTSGLTDMRAAPEVTAAPKPGPAAATTGGAVAAAAAAGGAPGGTHASEPNKGLVSDYDMRKSGYKSTADGDVPYDQVSPRTSNTNGKKGAQTSHATKGDKGRKLSHTANGAKGAKTGNTAYGDNEAKTSNSAYNPYSNEAQANNAAYNPYDNEAHASNTAYDNEAQASNATYGKEAQPSSTPRGGKEEQTGNGVSRRGTKTAERGGRHVLHKDPPAHHPVAAMAGVE